MGGAGRISHDGGKVNHRVLWASTSRSLITTWRDQTSLLDNPLPDAVDDALYIANHHLLPPGGTPVLIFFRAPTDKERAAILEIEKTYAP